MRVSGRPPAGDAVCARTSGGLAHIAPGIIATRTTRTDAPRVITGFLLLAGDRQLNVDVMHLREPVPRASAAIGQEPLARIAVCEKLESEGGSDDYCP
jgi:hypothetical protein